MDARVKTVLFDVRGHGYSVHIPSLKRVDFQKTAVRYSDGPLSLTLHLTLLGLTLNLTITL